MHDVVVGLPLKSSGGLTSEDIFFTLSGSKTERWGVPGKRALAECARALPASARNLRASQLSPPVFAFSSSFFHDDTPQWCRT